MLILPEEINKILAISGNDVTKYGKKLFEQGKVKIESVEYKSDNEFEIITLVNEGVDNRVIFNKNDKKIEHSCSCEFYEKKIVPCKHVIATLFDVYICFDKYISFKNDTSIENFEKKLNVESKAINKLEKMFEAFYQNKIINYYENLEFGNNTKSENIKLIPKLEVSGFNNQNLFVTFKLGKNRLYVIKNIYDFGYNFINSHKYKYGKELELVHDIDRFAEEDKSLVEFVCSKTNEYLNFSKQDRYFSIEKHYAPKLNLNYSALDEFFEICKEKEIEIVDYDYTDVIKLVEEDPVFNFEVDESDNGIEIKNIIYDDYAIYFGQKFNYVLYKDKLHKCSKIFSENIIPILKEYNNNRTNKLTFSLEQATSFCEYVLPKIKTLVNVECKSEVIKKYKAESLNTKIYLDINELGSIIAEVKFCYLNNEFNPFLDMSKIKANRNKLQEQKVKELLINNHFKLNRKDGTLYIDNDEDIYDFLENGINIFMEKFEVMVTDKFKNKNIINPKSVSMGLRIKNNLLEIEIDDLGFDSQELTNVIKSYRQKKKFYRLKDGSFVNIDSSGIDTLVNITDSLGVDEKELQKRRINIPKYRAIYLDEVLKSSDDINVKKENTFKNVVRSMSYAKELDFKVPDDMANILREYQKVGYNWLMTLDNLRIWWNTCR